jgi:hypothetical protein
MGKRVKIMKLLNYWKEKFWWAMAMLVFLVLPCIFFLNRALAVMAQPYRLADFIILLILSILFGIIPLFAIRKWLIESFKVVAGRVESMEGKIKIKHMYMYNPRNNTVMIGAKAKINHMDIKESYEVVSYRGELGQDPGKLDIKNEYYKPYIEKHKEILSQMFDLQGDYMITHLPGSKVILSIEKIKEEGR